MKFIKKNWRYILLWSIIATITQVVLENIGDGGFDSFQRSYWFLTIVVPTLVILIISWRKK